MGILSVVWIANLRARGATLKVGGLNSDSKWGGWKHLFLSNSLKFPKKWGGGLKPPQPLPLRGPWTVRDLNQSWFSFLCQLAGFEPLFNVTFFCFSVWKDQACAIVRCTVCDVISTSLTTLTERPADEVSLGQIIREIKRTRTAEMRPILKKMI